MKTLALAFLILIALSGCRTTTEPVREPYGGETRLDTYTGVGVNISGRLNEARTLDPAPFVGQFLPNQQMKIVDAVAAPNDNGMVRVQFSIQNRSDKKQAFQYRFTWTDADGFVVQPDQNPWQSVHLAGREVGTIESVARSERAVAFSLMIRPLDFKK
ncbi:MAG: DUF1425 domain-containing protein [Oceanipulchritudo sp.]